MTKKPSFSGALALGFLILAGLVMGGLFLKRIGGPPKEDAAPMAAE
jgi:hypothetical protein